MQPRTHSSPRHLTARATQLGEGGFSFVYLCQEADSIHAVSPGQSFALKKIVAVSADQLAEARHEIAIMRKLDHPNLLPLLASAILPSQKGGVPQHLCYMLFPVYAVRLTEIAVSPLQTCLHLSDICAAGRLCV